MINKPNKAFKWMLLSGICLLLLIAANLDRINFLTDMVIEIVDKINVKDIVNIVAILSGISGILVV